MAFLVGCMAIVFLRKVKEQGEVGRNVIITELVFLARRRMRNLSTIGGISFLSGKKPCIEQRQAQRTIITTLGAYALHDGLR